MDRGLHGHGGEVLGERGRIRRLWPMSGCDKGNAVDDRACDPTVPRDQRQVSQSLSLSQIPLPPAARAEFHHFLPPNLQVPPSRQLTMYAYAICYRSQASRLPLAGG